MPELLNAALNIGISFFYLRRKRFFGRKGFAGHWTGPYVGQRKMDLERRFLNVDIQSLMNVYTYVKEQKISLKDYEDRLMTETNRRHRAATTNTMYT